MNVGSFSYIFAFIAFAVLTLLLAFSWKGQKPGRIAILASATTSVWAGVSALTLIYGVSIPYALPIAELLRNTTWCLFLLYATGEFATRPLIKSLPISPKKLFLIFTGVSFLFVLLYPFIQSEQLQGIAREGAQIVWVLYALIGMLLVEHLFRNADSNQRWALKYLCLGVGSIFAYDFFMFSDAMLFEQLNPDLWHARGIVNGLMVPLIAISVARNPSWSLKIHVSRQAVFHSVTIMGAGGYLLAMATAGYYIKFYGGSWGSTLQITFLAGSISLLLVLLFSGTIRSRIRVFLSKHFFTFKYDYREEWRKFTKTLSEGESDIPTRCIIAISALVDSDGGDLWLKQESSHYELTAKWNMPEPEQAIIRSNSSLIRFLKNQHWLIDLGEYDESPDLYQGLELPDWMVNLPRAWLIAPLLFKGQLFGFIVIRKSHTKRAMNWEDRDLLKMAGQQAAIHLAQFQADQDLTEAKQFEAFNRLSAYVVHDLKNILAQQALIVSNAEKHKHNPLFVEDVIKTVQNSVGRMTRLMEQMKSGMRNPDCSQEINLNLIVEKVVKDRASQQPTPMFQHSDSQVTVKTNREELATVLGHIIQNAQDATDKNGTVSVKVYQEQGFACIDVIDTGKGMEAEFIKERLFRPFDSTKGLTGMGIGAYESREFIRSLGGDILVSSCPGKGSTFKISLPCILE